MTVPWRAALAGACEQHFGAGELCGLERLSGGASQETWRFQYVGADGSPRPLILRKDSAEESVANDRPTEFAVMRAVNRAGIHSPLPYFLTRELSGRAGFVMDCIEGETIARRILREDAYANARRKLAAQCGEQLAAIHAVPVDDLPALPRADSARAQVAAERARLDSFGDPHPVFELALRWLDDHLPPTGPRVLVHGDFRNGNLIVGEDGLRAVLDWELSHLGDPMEDLGWLCVKSWRFGAEPAVGGFGSRAQLFDAYTAAGGQAVDPTTVRFWQVYGTLKWGLICKVQAQIHRSGLRRSMELAALGRRVCETEHDLLQLIG